MFGDALDLFENACRIRSIDAVLPPHLRTGDANTVLLGADLGHVTRAATSQLHEEGLPNGWNHGLRGSIVNLGRPVDLQQAHLALSSMGLHPVHTLNQLLIATFGLGTQPLTTQIVALAGIYVLDTFVPNVGLPISFAYGAKPDAGEPRRDLFVYDNQFDSDCWYLCETRPA